MSGAVRNPWALIISVVAPSQPAKDKEALVKFYIASGKRFDAPALYRESAILLRKYGMYQEELSVLEAGMKNVSKKNSHYKELTERRKKVLELISKNS